MRGRGAGRNNGGGGGPPADLLMCFPARAHLALMPKPICSPSRSADAPKRHPSRSAARGQVASPLVRFNKRRNPTTTVRAPAVAEVISEPTSPKVTCAGQIKVSRPKTSKLPASSSRDNKHSWLSLMEEMAELRHRRRRGRGHSWLEALGLKKEAVHLLHGLRLRMRCFGSFCNPAAGCTGVLEDQDDSSAGEDEEEEEEEDEEGKQGDAHQTIFSKWFMLLEESPNDQGSQKRKVKDEDQLDQEEEEEDVEEEEEEERGGFGGCLVTPSSPSASSSAPQPPPNALLLMRCLSAPSKGWPEGWAAAPGGAQQGDQVTTTKNYLREDEKEKERQLLMSYAPDFFKVSPDIAKETWLAGSLDPLLRCRSWKR